jgi:hypothetical protein
MWKLNINHGKEPQTSLSGALLLVADATHFISLEILQYNDYSFVSLIKTSPLSTIFASCKLTSLLWTRKWRAVIDMVKKTHNGGDHEIWLQATIMSALTHTWRSMFDISQLIIFFIHLTLTCPIPSQNTQSFLVKLNILKFTWRQVLSWTWKLQLVNYLRAPIFCEFQVQRI